MRHRVTLFDDSIFFPSNFQDTTFYSFDEVMLFLYSTLWMLQIVACLAYCLYSKRYLPSKIYKSHLLLRQINLYMIGVIVFYMGESAFSQIIFKFFEKFLHHIFATFLFASAIYEPNLICLNWMLPNFVHASYWSLVKFFSFHI